MHSFNLILIFFEIFTEKWGVQKGGPGFVYPRTLLLYICIMYVLLKPKNMLYTCTCMSISTLALNCTDIVRLLKVNRDLPPKGKLEVYFLTLLTLIHVQCTCNLKYNCFPGKHSAGGGFGLPKPSGQDDQTLTPRWVCEVLHVFYMYNVYTCQNIFFMGMVAGRITDKVGTTSHEFVVSQTW